jgi:hypothetical protein
MSRTRLFIMLWLAIAGGANAAEGEARERAGVPPRLVTVLEVRQKEGELVLASVMVRNVVEQRIRVVEVNGKSEEVAYTVMKPVFEERSELIDLNRAWVFEGSGKELSKEEVWKRVAAGVAVALSGDGKDVTPVYMRALATETLVIVSPQSAKPAEEAGGERPFSPRKK